MNHQNSTAKAFELLAKSGHQVKLCADEKIPADALHVCADRPAMNVTNHETTCTFCGCLLYFSDATQPHLKKVCVRCAHARCAGKDTEVENLVTQRTLDIINQAGKQN